MLERDPANLQWDQTVPTRLAATVLPVRPARDRGFELLLVERPAGDRFAGGQSVFPGGKVDDADRAGLAAEVLPVDAGRWALGPLAELAAELRAAVVRAATRELAEESGICLDGAPAPDFDRDAGRFYADLAAAGRQLDTGALEYWVNWVTPKQIPMRFDTHFFVVPVEADLTLRPNPGEVVAARWLHPADALAQAMAGAIELMFPTWRSLEQLAPFDRMDDLLGFVRAFPKIRVEPELNRDDGGAIQLTMPDAWPEPLQAGGRPKT